MTLPPRRGARRRSEIPADLLVALQQGHLASANLVEWLAVDQVALLRHVAPHLGLGEQTSRLLDELTTCDLGPGVVQPMVSVGALLMKHAAACSDANAVLAFLRHHPSDTVRGWGAFLLAAAHHLSFAEQLERMVPFAIDDHFGVREFAWLALRPAVVRDPVACIADLHAWVHATNPYTRRFAVEITRPRGVWCAHVARLKEQPELARGLLESARADVATYVQDSVANWLNDASKTQPAWVTTLCDRWQIESPNTATRRIIHRAQRTLRKAALTK